MRNKDFIRLAKYSIENNKKQTRNTVRGIVFGATMLVTLLFVLVSFYGGTMSEINKEKVVSSFQLRYQITSEDTSKLNQEIKKELLTDPAIKESIVYERIHLSYPINHEIIDYPTISIGGVDYLYDYKYREDLEKSAEILHFCDTSNSATLITTEEEKFLERHGYGKSILAGSLFTESMDEVLVSSQVLDYLKIDYEDAINQLLTYKINITNWSSAFDSSMDKYFSSLAGEEIMVIRNYKIVGVFNSNLYVIFAMNLMEEVFEYLNYNRK